MDFYEAVRLRRSIRKYKPDPVEQEKLGRVLEAARLAPSAANRQPWQFIVITDAKRREAMKAAYDREWFWKAPVIIAACLDTAACWKRQGDGKSYGDVDVAIAFDHLTLAAAELGLGTCWIGAFNPVEARRLLELPAGVEPIALTPLGYPAGEAKPRSRKGLNEIVKWERF